MTTPVHIKDLVPDPENRRQHNPRNIGMIVDALHHVGAARSIVIDEHGAILAGNGTVDAAAEAGITRVQVVDADGETIIAVRRTGLSVDQKRALALFDNRAAELATWDVEQLHADVRSGLSLAAFWTDDESLSLLARLQNAEGLVDADAIPEIGVTDIQLGDLFEAGRHRVLCGDGTQADDVARVLGDAKPVLMVTDPPYGVAYDPTWRANAGMNRNRKKLGTVENDDRADWTDAWRLFPGDIAYVWHGGLKAGTVQESLALAGFTVRAQIIWAKDRLALSRGDYHWQHEPCWYAVRDGRPGHRTDDRSQSTLWTIPAREDRGHGHGTQKPVECMARALRNHLAADVYDPFVGSGTTLIAAETCGRRCFAVEIAPQYVQVAIDRWQAFTGETARKIKQAPRV
jgi:DNA modification methylase